MKKYIRLYRSSGSDPPVVVHDHIAEHYGLHDGDTVPHDLLPAILDDCRKLNEMFYQIETAKKRGAAMKTFRIEERDYDYLETLPDWAERKNPYRIGKFAIGDEIRFKKMGGLGESHISATITKLYLDRGSRWVRFEQFRLLSPAEQVYE